MMSRFWTDIVIDDVLSRIRAGERTADIAEEYAISAASLRSVIWQRRGSVVSEARQKMYADMAKLWEAGWTVPQIAHKYNMNPQTLAHIITRRRDLFLRKNKRRAKA